MGCWSGPRALLLALLVLLVPSTIPPVNATGTLFVDPANIPVQPLGTVVNYVVNVANMDPFNGWDVMVQVNSSVIQPQSLSTLINTLTANFSLVLNEKVNCVNGTGTGCTSMDGPGIVHSAVEASGLPPPGTSITGILFIITYQVNGPGQFSPVQIISGVVTAGVTPVDHTTLDASYGFPPPTGPPDFSLDVIPDSETIPTGASLNCCLVILTSLEGFSGTISLAVDVSPLGGVTASLNTLSITLGPAETGIASLQVSAPAAIPLGIYTVTVTGTSSSLSHSDSVSITVTLGADFTFIEAIPATLTIQPGTEGTSQIALTPMNGFKGVISLTAAVSPALANGPVARMDPDMVSIFFDVGAVLTFLRVSTTALTPIGTYNITVIGNSGALSHSIAIIVIVPDTSPPDTSIPSVVDGNFNVLSNGGATLSDSVSFTFAGTDNVAVAGFECSLDGFSFSACTSPTTYSGLALGSHTFQVRAKDPSDNVDPSPALFSWTVESPPDTSIVSVFPPIQNGGDTRSRFIRFTFTGTDNLGIQGFECSLDGTAFTSCSSPVFYMVARGMHIFQVRAVDTAGFADPTPVVFTWTVL